MGVFADRWDWVMGSEIGDGVWIWSLEMGMEFADGWAWVIGSEIRDGVGFLGNRSENCFKIFCISDLIRFGFPGKISISLIKSKCKGSLDQILGAICALCEKEKRLVKIRSSTPSCFPRYDPDLKGNLSMGWWVPNGEILRHSSCERIRNNESPARMTFLIINLF